MLTRIVVAMGVLTSCYQSQKNETNQTTIVLHPVSELSQEPETKEDGTPVLIGGRAADPKDWPASMYASMGGASCTATIVGERALLIAAHCVSSGGKAQFKAAGESYSAVCLHSRDYQGNQTADYAACEIDRPVTGVPFELVNTEPAFVKVGEEILMTGFGCTISGGGGGNDGVYRIGESIIAKLPQGNDNDLVTKGPAVLCFGDSGGPAFKIVGNKRYQLSINSRVHFQSKSSYLSYLASQQGTRFLKAWTEKTGHKICGMHADAVGCRGQGEGPGPTPPPTNCKEAYDKLGKCLFGTGTLAIAPAVCYQAAGSMFQCLEEKYK